MKFPIENEIFIPGPSLAAEKQGLGLKFSIENEIFKPRMKISSENENFVRGGMVFSCVRARMNFFDPRALWEGGVAQICRKLRAKFAETCRYFVSYIRERVREFVANLKVNPDPPTLAFLEKSKGNPEKSKGSSLHGTLKSLEKKGTTHKKKNKGNRKTKKSKEIEKKQGLEGQGISDNLCANAPFPMPPSPYF